MPWTGNPATWIANSLLTASQLNLELRDRMVVLRAGGFALASQVTDDVMTALSATQWGRITRAELLEGVALDSYQFSATFTGGGGAEDVDVDVTSVGLSAITKGVVIPQTAISSEGVNVSCYLTSATNARVSSDGTINAITVRFSVLKLGA